MDSVNHFDRRDESTVLPFHLSVDPGSQINNTQIHAIHAIQKKAARLAITSFQSGSTKGITHHLGAGLDLIPAFTLTQSVLPAGTGQYSVQIDHSLIGYYSVLATLGYLVDDGVSDLFQRSLDPGKGIPHVPGGADGLRTPWPAVQGKAVEMRRKSPETAWFISHTCCSQWVTGWVPLQASPMTIILHRNGIDLAKSKWKREALDIRTRMASFDIDILEVKSLLDTHELYAAYQEGKSLALEGKTNLIYPTGYVSEPGNTISFESLGDHYGIADAVESFTWGRKLRMDQEIWVPGSLMFYRDVMPMLECISIANGLPGRKWMRKSKAVGRRPEDRLDNPMLMDLEEEISALERLENEHPIMVISDLNGQR